jgi:UDPglucose 6-dehydrogenase
VHGLCLFNVLMALLGVAAFVQGYPRKSHRRTGTGKLMSFSNSEPGVLPRLSVVGLGKFGSPFAAVMAKKGFETIGVDLNSKSIDAINFLMAPVIEPQLQEYIELSKGRLRATTDHREAVINSDVSFVILPTPSESDGCFTNKYVVDAVETIGSALRDKDDYHLVVIASTVMPGATGGPIKTALERSSGRRVGDTVGLCYNPGFIAMGSVIRDVLHPDFILIGESDERAGAILAAIYRTCCDNDPPLRRMNFINAELCKISINTYLGTKISYANMLADICDQLPDADVEDVLQGVGSDARVGPKYLKAATGYGGPCFPRDNKALAALGRRLGVRCDLAEATDTINDHQLERLLNAVRRNAPSDAKVAVLGLSYKPDTYIVEESQGVALAARLSADGYIVTVYDPLAMPAAEAALGNRVIYANSVDQALDRANVAVITTSWPQFETACRRVERGRENPLTIIDPWRVMDRDAAGVSIIRMGYGPNGERSPRVVPIKRKSC